MEKSASVGKLVSNKKISFEQFYSFFTSLNCSNHLKFWMVSEGCLKLVDEKDLEVEHFRKIYDDFLRTSAPLKVRTSSLTVRRMKMCIDFACITELASVLLTAQMEVYPSLFTNLAADLGFMCGLFAHHFAKLQSGYITCVEGDRLEKRANYVSDCRSQSTGPSTAIIPEVGATAYKKRDQMSDIFFMQVCHRLTKVQKERDQWQGNARKEARQQGKTEEFISSLQWYDDSGCKSKYKF